MISRLFSPKAGIFGDHCGGRGADQVPTNPKTLEVVGGEVFAFPDRKRKPMELGIEFCLELVIVFYQLGRELMGLPVNVPLGAGCWVIAMLIAIRILWILPIMSPVPNLVKASTGLLILAIARWVSYHTVEEAFRKQRAGEQLSPDTKVVLGALSGIQRGLDILARPSGSTPSHTEATSKSVSTTVRSPVTAKSANPYTLLGDAELIAVSKVVAKQIDDLMGAWEFQIEHEIEPRRNDQVYKRDPVPEEDERNRLDAYYDKEIEEANQKYGSEAKKLFIGAEALRDVLVNRLGQKNSMPLPNDSKVNDLFKGLSETVPTTYRGDSSKVSAHLLDLCKRLEQAQG